MVNPRKQENKGGVMPDQIARPKKCRIVRVVEENEEYSFTPSLGVMKKKLLPDEEHFHIGFAHDGSHLLNIFEGPYIIIIAVPKDAVIIIG
jgi:hypothetical protein